MSHTADPERTAVMSLGQHLDELRRRLIVCLATFGAALVASWAFRQWIIAVLVRPHVQAAKAFEMDVLLKYQTYLEPTLAQMKACAVAATVLSAPVIIFEVWAFVAPGLFPHERRKVIKLGAASLACFAAGIAFGYFLFVPVMLRCLLLLAGPSVEPVLMFGQYLDTFYLLTLALGLAFQTPVVVYFLLRWGILTPESLRGARRTVIIGAFVFAAILTPTTDPLTQTMMAAALIILYDLGALVGAPSRHTLFAFLQFTGLALAALIGLALWYYAWPVAKVSAVRGSVMAGERVVQGSASVGVRRGQTCRAGPDGVARFAFGHGAVLYLADGARLAAYRPDGARLLAGECLVEGRDADHAFTVQAGPARVEVGAARAELQVPDDQTVTVTVLEGEASVREGQTVHHVLAGRMLTVQAGGTQTDLSVPAERWRARLPGGWERPGK